MRKEGVSLSAPVFQDYGTQVQFNMVSTDTKKDEDKTSENHVHQRIMSPEGVLLTYILEL